MSIVQSILLLLCVGLVIFSRVSAAGHLDFSGINSGHRNPSEFPVDSPLESPPESPEYRRKGLLRGDRPWLDVEDGKPRSEESAISRSRSSDNSPPTPISSYSRSEGGLTPQYMQDEMDIENSTDFASGTPEHFGIPTVPSASKSKSLGQHDNVNETPREDFQSSSPTRTPKKRRGFIRQQPSPPVTRPSANKLRDENDQNLDLQPDSTWIIEDQIGVADGSSRLPSPPPETERPSFSIARKPLPALPTRTEDY